MTIIDVLEAFARGDAVTLGGVTFIPWDAETIVVVRGDVGCSMPRLSAFEEIGETGALEPLDLDVREEDE